MDISLGLKGTHVLVTGGAGLIGSKVVEAFAAAGAKVSSLDISYPHAKSITATHIEIHVDTTSEESVNRAWRTATDSYGPVETCIALAALDLSVLPHHDSSVDMSLDQFRRTLEVNVVGTFAVAQLWLLGLKMCSTLDNVKPEPLKNVSLILVGSESGHWGEASNADYGTSKAAVQYGLLQSLRQDAPRVYPGARVNAIAPGPVNTARFKEECENNPTQYYEDCVATTALARPVEVEDVARSMLFLASDRYSRSVHGQILNVDSGKLGKLVHKET
jgi:NAD(P)-dependent dehydrogenase (short-subunit alcohol dehydrogenase family)